MSNIQRPPSQKVAVELNAKGHDLLFKIWLHVTQKKLTKLVISNLFRLWCNKAPGQDITVNKEIFRIPIFLIENVFGGFMFLIF